MGVGEILVFCEKPALLGELIGKARLSAGATGGRVSAVSWDGLVEAGQAPALGAGVLYQAGLRSDLSGDPDTCVALLAAAIAQAQPGLVLVGATKLGMEVAPRLAERTQSGYAAWAVDFSLDPDSGAASAECMLYAGIGQATYHFKPGMAILTMAHGVAVEGEAGLRPAEIQPLEVLPGERLAIHGQQPKAASGARLEEAKLVVDVGQGVKQVDDLQMLRSLAALLDGQLGCTRPVASDRDWFPEWLGLSGAKIKPELCLSVGVSGAIQHIVGIRDARLIAAVNIDENAAIFSQADYGVVADLYSFLPAFMERISARRVKPAWIN